MAPSPPGLAAHRGAIPCVLRRGRRGEGSDGQCRPPETRRQDNEGDPMKFISVREAKAQFSECLDDAQREGIIVTNHGKPAAVIVGVEGYDADEVILMANPRFWQMIEQRRAEPTTHLSDFEAELDASAPKR